MAKTSNKYVDTSHDFRASKSFTKKSKLIKILAILIIITGISGCIFILTPFSTDNEPSFYVRIEKEQADNPDE